LFGATFLSPKFVWVILKCRSALDQRDSEICALFGTLRSADLYFLSDILGKPVGPFFKGQEFQAECWHPSWNPLSR